MNLEAWKFVAVLLTALHSTQSYDANQNVMAQPGNYDLDVRRSQNGDRWSIRNMVDIRCANFRRATEVKYSRTCECPLSHPHFFSKDGKEPGCYASEEIDHEDQSKYYLFFQFIYTISLYHQCCLYDLTHMRRKAIIL